jgi:hypothetical protein
MASIVAFLESDALGDLLVRSLFLRALARPCGVMTETPWWDRLDKLEELNFERALPYRRTHARHNSRH